MEKKENREPREIREQEDFPLCFSRISRGSRLKNFLTRVLPGPMDNRVKRVFKQAPPIPHADGVKRAMLPRGRAALPDSPGKGKLRRAVIRFREITSPRSRKAKSGADRVFPAVLWKDCACLL